MTLYRYRGYNFGFSAFLNGQFLGSGQGRSGSDPAGGIDLVNATYTFPTGFDGRGSKDFELGRGSRLHIAGNSNRRSFDRRIPNQIGAKDKHTAGAWAKVVSSVARRATNTRLPNSRSQPSLICYPDARLSDRNARKARRSRRTQNKCGAIRDRCGDARRRRCGGSRVGVERGRSGLVRSV